MSVVWCVCDISAECDHMCDPGADLVPALLTVSASLVQPAAADPDDDGKVAAATPATHPFSLLSLRSGLLHFPIVELCEGGSSMVLCQCWHRL